MTPRSKKRLSALIRYAVCIVAIAYLVTHNDWAEFKQVVISANWRLVLLSLIALGPGPVIISLRLKLLLDVHDIHLTAWQAIKITFAGNFIINALPFGTGGGDAVKAYYIARTTPHKHEAITTVLFDRVIGVVGLVGLAGVILLINWDNEAFWSNPTSQRVGRSIAIAALAMFVVGCVYFSHRLRRLFRLDKIVLVLPFASHFQRIDRAAFAFRDRIGRLVVCMLLTVILQVVCVISVFIGGWALGMVGDAPLSAFPIYLGYVPICFLCGALPIGVMEEVFYQLFVNAANLDATREAATSLSFLSRLTQLVWALPGILYVLKAGRPAASEADLLEESPDEAAAEPASGA